MIRSEDSQKIISFYLLIHIQDYNKTIPDKANRVQENHKELSDVTLLNMFS